MKKVGVLALQGAFQKHYEVVTELGYSANLIRSLEELHTIDALILPGGESTTMGKLMNWYKLLAPIRMRILDGMPVFGTCAGMILLAKETENNQENLLGLMNIKVERNAYGTQIESFETSIQVKGLEKPVEAIFIRAPRITKTGLDIEVLSDYENAPVLVKEKNMMAASFHPELTSDYRIHEMFLKLV